MSAAVPGLGPVEFRMRPPGSKSETIRALAAASLASGRSHIYGALQSEDTEAMAAALQALGVEISVRDEPWAVDGEGGRLHSPTKPIDANESGLSARILIAMASSADGESTITGRGRLPERPMAGLVAALRSQGVELSDDRLPIMVGGRGPLWGGSIRVDCSESTQFATALMLVAPTMHDPCVLELDGMSGSTGYLDVTADVMRRFGARIERTVTGYEIANTGYIATDFVVSPDASAAVYPMGIAAVTGGKAVIEGIGSKSRQPDMRVAHALQQMGCNVMWTEDSVSIDGSRRLSGIDIDMSEAPDGALALAVVCLFADSPSHITGLHSLRHKESDRLEAIRSEVSRIGGDIAIVEDSLRIEGGRPLQGAEIDPHGDHRIAMSLAIAGTVIEGMTVGDPDVVAKTWPGFWGFLDDVAR